MKCPKCGGNGKEYWNGNVFCNTGFECDKCNGTGEVEQTNEERFCSLSTEEKATFLASNKMLNFDYQMWIEWLREVHK